MKIPVLLCRPVFTDRDGSTGEMYLMSNDLGLSDQKFETLCKKRWCVEEYHESLKQNAALGKSPARIPVTQHNH